MYDIPLSMTKYELGLVKITSFMFLQVVYVTPPSTKKAEKKEGE